jgi:hypothetical protein
LLVADTSALLDRPDPHNWKLDGQAWTVVFTPQVLAELDERKRDPHTRAAAQKSFDSWRTSTAAVIPPSGYR